MKMMYRKYEYCEGHGRPGAVHQDVRRYAEEHGFTKDEVLQQGMKSKAVEFVKSGAEIYKKA